MINLFFNNMHLNLLCIFCNAFILIFSFENDSSTLQNAEYETFFENYTYSILDQNQSQWYNTSVMNITEENETSSSVNERIDPYWNWYDSYLSHITPEENICICDLYYNVCDINCCCDLDCNEDDMKVFSSCYGQVSHVDESYCYLTNIILKNNTVYQIQKNPTNGLFCIVHNNLKQYLRFKDLPLLKSNRDLDVLLNYQSKIIYSWHTEVKEPESEEQETKSGNSILISVSEMETIWSLPHSCFVDSCTCNKRVLYLTDYSSSCTRVINDLEEDCENNDALSGNTFINFCYFSNNLFAQSQVLNSKNTEVNKLCFTKMKEPIFLKETNTCSNVVNNIHFTVFHDGILGIQEIKPNISFVSLTPHNTSLTQHFSVEFKWTNSINTTKRSGNPGYQVGLNIIIGTNDSVEEPFNIKIQEGGLSIFGKDSLSQCQNSPRKSIKFGMNYKTSCYFNAIINDCKALQKQIEDILLGPSRENVLVGMFGNANESNREEWIEAYHEEYDFTNNNGICHFMTGLKINVVYAAMGTVQNPQFKILGLGYRYLYFKDINIGEKLKNTILTSSVSFFDVTEPVIPDYPKAPSLKVNLPADFFYPFLQAS